MKKNLLTFFSAFFITPLLISQTQFADVTVTVQRVQDDHECGCNDGGFLQCGFASSQPDPSWRIRSQYFGGSFSGTTFIEYDDQDCASRTRSDVLDTYTGICSDLLTIEIEAWEDDGCGSNDTYDVGCVNNDADHSGIQTFNISYQTDPTGVVNIYPFTLSNGYQVDIGVLWNVAAVVNSPSISGVTTLCSGDALSLTASEVSATNFNWYDVSSGGTPVSTGATLNVSNVTSNTSYYVAGTIGTCEGPRTQVDIIVETLSTDPSSLTPSSATLCSAGTVDFTITGGSLGTGATWELYTGSCGGSLIGSSATGVFTGINVSATETYYALANGNCNTTNCATTTVTLETLSTDPSAASASNSSICSGDPVTLSVVGGNLGTGATWEWYSGTCGGTSVGSGPIISLNPTITTDYFVRAEGSCGITNCATVTVTVTPAPISIDSALANIYTVCPEDPVQLNAYYSTSLPAGYTITWFTGACGAVPIGVGDSIVVAPTDTTIYYVQCIGTCGVSSCDTIQVNVLDGSTSPTSITASNNNFCGGSNSTLTVNGGSLATGAQWTWYEGTCGGSAIGSGNSINVTPSVSTMYYVMATGGSCGNSLCASVFINVFDLNVNQVPFDTVCGSNGFTLTGGFPTGGTYSGAGVNAGVFDPLAAGVGSHPITYSYTDGNGCSDSAIENIVVLESNPAPVSINASSTQICNGASTTIWLDSLSNVLITGRMWVWYEGACGAGVPIDTTYNDTISGQDTSIVVSPSTTTNYYVRAEGGICDPSECIGITIDVYNLETNLLSFDDVCGVDAPAFALTGGIPSGGTYSGTGVTNDIFDPLAADTGTHLITYTYTSGGCTITDSENITVNTSPINVHYTIEAETCSEGGILIHVHSTDGSGFYSYSWSDGSVDNPLTYAQPGDYTVLVSDANDCTTLLGPISISEDLACIEMPNTFTPNGDGTNDTWNLDFSSYGSAHLTIYSKWGKIVREFNEVNISWDGIFEGNPLPAGTYYYILELDSGIVQNGPVTIVR